MVFMPPKVPGIPDIAAPQDPCHADDVLEACRLTVSTMGACIGVRGGPVTSEHLKQSLVYTRDLLNASHPPAIDVNEGLRALFAEFRKELKADMKTMEDSLKADMKTMEDSLKADIETLKGKVDTVETTLKAEVRDAETRIKERIDTVDGHLTAVRIAAAKTHNKLQDRGTDHNQYVPVPNSLGKEPPAGYPRLNTVAAIKGLDKRDTRKYHKFYYPDVFVPAALDAEILKELHDDLIEAVGGNS
ncbi:hypothetical protein EUX98_g5412 [Antrodiella citrinella]|uniref:Mug135-like C-terminal domain-containing protein n=1 Tax=Antrodiella citrinella TaxID=2447956 RepID=A0A4S4MRM1_9APHY|nr:hypothetical protein EUX98_g5412 [Antrodiella citrinella]